MKIMSRSVMLLGVVVAISGCSGGTEDVRISFCRDLMSNHLGQVNWTGADYRVQEPEFAEITLTHEGGTAACYYDRTLIEDSAMTLSDPLSAYATTPYKITVNGKDVSIGDMDKLVVMTSKQMGREIVEQVKQGAKEAAEGVKEAAEKAGEALKRE